MGTATKDLWGLVWGKPEIDPTALALAVERELTRDELDFRTRLLIRDCTQVLAQYMGPARWEEWLNTSPVRRRIEAIQHEDLGEPRFLLTKERLVKPTDPEVVKAFLRELGTRIHRPLRLQVGGSVALILTGHLSRATADIDVVDEVPPEIREQRELLHELSRRYELQLTHFQSHYLPAGWETRLYFQGTFGNLEVFTVDVYDLFLGKLFSRRTRDRDDLRVLAPQLDKEMLTKRLRATTASLQADPALRQQAEMNWYIVFGEAFPS